MRRLGHPLTLALILAIGAGALWVDARRGDPSAGEVRDAVERLFGDECASDISVRRIDALGGPGLPEGMRAAREIVCEADLEGMKPEDQAAHPSIAVQFVFESDAAAHRWMEGDYVDGDWWLEDGTLVAGGSLTKAQWRRLLAELR